MSLLFVTLDAATNFLKEEKVPGVTDDSMPYRTTGIEIFRNCFRCEVMNLYCT